MRVGSKELKNRLGHYLREVRSGARVVVTDRGTPIALVVPLPEDHVEAGEAGLDELEREGLLARGTGRRWRDFDAVEVAPGSSVSALVVAEREPAAARATRLLAAARAEGLRVQQPSG